MTELQWPDRRQDVVNALAALATLEPEDAEPWPDLTNAVHWLIDDTSWDQHPPAEEIGLLLHNQAEADAIGAVIEPLMKILAEIGPTRPDTDYLTHPHWSHLRKAAHTAHRLLTAERDTDRQD